MNKKSEFGLGPLACVEWVGGKDITSMGEPKLYGQMAEQQ